MSLRTVISRALPIALLMVATMIGGAGTAGALAERAAIDVPDVLLIVTPSTGLVDDQAVTITAPSDVDSYALCLTTGVTEPDLCGYLADHDPDRSTDDVHIPVRATVYDDTGSVSIVDCRTTSCSLVAVTYSSSGGVFSPAVLAHKALTFDPAAALRPSPTISVTPSVNLVDGQHVNVAATISGAGLSAGNVFAVMCPQPVTDVNDLSAFSGSCDFEGAVNFAGPHTGIATLATYINTPSGPVDCRASDATCTMVTVDQVGQIAHAPLSFTPGRPVKPALLQHPFDQIGPFDPSMQATYDLVGFTPNDPFTVQWCNDAGQCLPPVVASGTLDAHGLANFTGDDFPDGPTDDTTCSISCSLTATDAHGLAATGGPQFAVVTPIPDGPFKSKRLPVSVSPHKGLNDGDTVTVTASGFTPGANLAIVECTGDAVTDQEDGCDVGTSSFLNGQRLTADAQGHLTATYTITRHISTPTHGDVDCATGNVDPDAYHKAIAEDPSRAFEELPGYFTCMVIVADMSDHNQSGGDLIAFAGALFKPLPWTRSPTPIAAPTPTPTAAKPAAAVAAQPTFAG